VSKERKHLQEQETRIYLALKESVQKGAFPPGFRLVERDLSEKFSASRTPVRWAIKRLVAEGFLEQMPSRGVCVRMLNATDAIELIYIREALEGMACRLAAANRTEEQAGRLRELIAQMAKVTAANDFLSYYRLSGQLHSLIFEASGNAHLCQMLDNLYLQVTRFQFRNLLVAGRIDRSVVEHGKIVDAICAADADSAERHMRQHIGIVRELIETESKKPDFIAF
jgi:DNA-binding GntR family transcriptional regulator